MGIIYASIFAHRRQRILSRIVVNQRCHNFIPHFSQRHKSNFILITHASIMPGKRKHSYLTYKIMSLYCFLYQFFYFCLTPFIQWLRGVMIVPPFTRTILPPPFPLAAKPQYPFERIPAIYHNTRLHITGRIYFSGLFNILFCEAISLSSTSDYLIRLLAWDILLPSFNWK